ncbi:hypothetical protein KAR48_09185 [bacterium]|nr:hypothetical protein [bacterium]
MSTSRKTILMLIGVLVLWALNILVLSQFFDAPESVSSFGDSFGCVSALFSGLAFVGLIVAILLQMEELKLQRKELSLTRDELEGQKKQLSLQNDTLKTQAFENMFFQLLQFQINLTESIDSVKPNNRGFVVTYKGKDCFVEFINKVRSEYSLNALKNLDTKKRLKTAVIKFKDMFDKELSHYLKSLYQIFKFLDEANIQKQQQYIDLLKAMLSNQEIIILLYLHVSDIISDELKMMLVKYQVYDDIIPGSSIDNNHEKLLKDIAV